ncbi:hypothetical protein AB1L30_01285 [Bremerella sp. JC817]|uniref:hypothetical protein n=1 Tax=Bremerella sp. JC817 TaxID=3231756 RepID=UPI0034586402
MSDKGPAVDLADGLACRLTDLGFATKRSHLPIIRTDDVEAVKIFAIPGGAQIKLQDRNRTAHEVIATVMVVKNLRNPEDQSELDGIAVTIEAIKRLWENPKHADTLGPNTGILRHALMAGLSWKGIANDELFLQSRLYEDNQAVSLITLTYHGTR